MAKPTTTAEDKRPRGRPSIAADAGGFRRVNLSLDDTSLATAARIHPLTSAAVRIALAYWAEHNVEASKPRSHAKK